jgi:hypothetical protein
MPPQTEDARPPAFEELPKHISYVPQGRGSGLQVRIWREGTTYQKFFAQSHFQTDEDCLAAARFWRDIKLQELPEPEGPGASQTEEVRGKISEQMTWTGIRGLGFQVGKKSGKFRLYASVQWREEGQNWSRIRSLHAHGIEGAANQLSRVLIEQIPEHEGKDPTDLAQRCKGALRRLISRIYKAGRYPSSRHGHEEERYEVLARFVEQDETLPIGLSGEDSSEENLPEEDLSEETPS